ncbi:hypothetical protein [Actinoallomurus soli]|uniref:hypothetical protein n=1 Tax=Actinoallomurus soli TaxID=2952535 RepID=UPI002093D68C|nr:hypothetical protein [Actinoallomurus soli]MCO5973447.1 hypothetical protein [Actinoallomurus soli]
MVEDGLPTSESGNTIQIRESIAAHLEALAERLREEGWYARVIVSEGQAALLRVNPLAPPLNDDLSLRRDQAGLWWFCWSFGDRIAHVDNLDIAAARIAQVLGRPEP